MTQEKGYLSIVLHAHLPFVRHPEHERFLEEQWFYEAVTETYIPLLKAMEKLLEEGTDFRLTLSLTPTLLSMLTDPLLQSRYVAHLDRMIELSSSEIGRTRHQPEFHDLASLYHGLFVGSREFFCDRYHCDLTTAFRRLADAGKLEIITCGATHGYLPLLELQPEMIQAQIRVAVQTHRRILGRSPRGIWLPECGYYPGLDDVLKKEGIRFFMMDTHGILFASPRPRFGIFAPVYCRSGVAAFGRDVESSKSVWSAEEGYPGDYAYREFYRDIGFDLDYDYVRPYLNGDGSRVPTGIKYYRITGPGNHKQPYRPDEARAKVAEHAGNFMFNREKQIEHLEGVLGRKPIVISPYDAELFGHWWFEGPYWLETLFRKIHHDQKTFRAITPMEYLQMYPLNQKTEPTLSSWGYNGYSEVWLNGSNDWLYRHLHKAGERMIEVSSRHSAGADAGRRRALNQMGRELLLAQSSDWAFILKTGTHTAYALKRIHEHLENFTRLWEQEEKNSIDRSYLEKLELKNNIFPDMQYECFSSAK